MNSHKYDYGHVLVIGGSPGMVGAPFLSAMAALRVGAGLVTIASGAAVIDKLEKRVVELMTLALPTDKTKQFLSSFIKDRKVSVVVIGPGTKSEFIEPLIEFVASLDMPVVVDGGALGVLARRSDLIKPHFILTPHAGEFKRFNQANPAQFAQKYGLVLVQKGQPSHVFGPTGQDYENDTGGPALATAGTGDTLTGLIAGIIAQKIEPYPAACAALYLGGRAADLAAADKTDAGVIASDIIDYIPAALKLVLKSDL